MAQGSSLSQYLAAESHPSVFVSIDVVSSTALKTGETEQDLMSTFLAYHRQASDLAYAHHGEVFNIAGDGILLRFQRMDDGARMAEAMLLELPRFNKTQNRLSRALQLRIGIHAGEVRGMEGLASSQWVSRVIDMSAKIQESAVPDTLRLSEDAFALLKENRSAYHRCGWDATLQTTLYQYQPAGQNAPAAARMPEVARVLLVDDELDDILRLRRALKERRRDLFAAYSTAQAVELLQAWKPHIILLSLDLPWEAGWNTLGRWRSESAHSSVPILTMSRQTTGETLQKAFQMGSNAFIGKPIEETQTLKRLELALREFYL